MKRHSLAIMAVLIVAGAILVSYRILVPAHKAVFGNSQPVKAQKTNQTKVIVAPARSGVINLEVHLNPTFAP